LTTSRQLTKFKEKSFVEGNNITATVNLLLCNMFRSKYAPPRTPVGTGMKIHEGATLMNYVEGNHFTIMNPISADETVFSIM